MQTPTFDGQVLTYEAVVGGPSTPRIYYVNGIQTTADSHAQSAFVLSAIAERPVVGVYNQSGGAGTPKGMVADLLQCGTDWVTAFASQLTESATGLVNKGLTGVRNLFSEAVGWVNRKTKLNLPRPKVENPVNVAAKLRTTLSEEKRQKLLGWLMARTNKATTSLFNELSAGRGQPQWVVAHSQGNLITADALWLMAIAFGNDSMANVRVFSLASPSPAWPAGIDHRRKVYGHTNDLVTLADPHNWSWITKNVLNGRFGRTAGDWRRFGPSWVPGLAAHDLNQNIFALNFANRLRRDLNLPEYADKPSPPK